MANSHTDSTGKSAKADSRSFLSKITTRMINEKPGSAAKMPNIRTEEALLLLQNYEESRQGWFWSTDASGKLCYLTDSIAETLDKDAEELIGSAFQNLFLKSVDQEGGQRSLPFVLAKQMPFTKMEVQAATDKDERWWCISGQPQFSKSGEFTGFRGSGVDITAQRRSERDTRKMAMFDSLTGLTNRAAMSKKFETTLKAYATQRRSCAVMLLDLDRFKQVNDTLGHSAGDELLKQASQRLLKAVGRRGEVSRIGGDEFKVMLPDVEDRGNLGDLSDDIISSLSQPYTIEGNRCVIGTSIGIAISPFDGQSCEEIDRHADLALYAAKGSGRGCFRFFSKELQQSAEDRRILEDDLRDALAKGEIALSYQPIVNSHKNSVNGFEALMRWEHPERGAISPAIFIPIAEETGLIGALGEWALRQACEDAVGWPGNTRVAVNVSPLQFASDALPGAVINALAASGLAPNRLELEITESVFLGETAETSKMFNRLKDLGVRLALDDFGTGYSSLSYLQTAPFDKIKIDQSFVRGATEPGSRNGAIIAAIVALAEALDMETTAEGIESLDQLQLIRDLNVSHVQGYIYSMPVSDEELRSRFEENEWVIEPSGPAKQRENRQAMFRNVSAIHENNCYSVTIRNLSMSGALMEGLLDVPLGTKFVIDFGEGQIVMATVRRSEKNQQGIEFSEKLVNDGNGSFCTAHRVSPYLIAAAGMPIPGMPADYYQPVDKRDARLNIPTFRTTKITKVA